MEINVGLQHADIKVFKMKVEILLKLFLKHFFKNSVFFFKLNECKLLKKINVINITMKYITVF